jgi:TetR/AcrR family transcriptional regulator, tetracycline repressor protein
MPMTKEQLPVTRTREPSSHTAAGISVAAIVEDALTVIAERGVAGLTMSAVAERLGVRSPSLYHHVRDKATLLDLVAQDAFGAFAADRDAYDDVASVDEWIVLTRSGTLRLREFYAAHPGLAGLIQATATRDRDRGDGSRASLVGAQLQALVRLGVPEPEARETFEACARWTMAAVAAEDHTGGGHDDALFHRGLDWLLHGVRADLVRAIDRPVSRRRPWPPNPPDTGARSNGDRRGGV